MRCKVGPSMSATPSAGRRLHVVRRRRTAQGECVLTLAILLQSNRADATETLTVRQQQAQILFALGVMGYFERGKRPHVVGEFFATGCFDWAIDEAKRRGFKGRKQLIGAARRGRATPFAIQKMEEACAFMTEAEVAMKLAQSAATIHFLETGRPMPGWSIKTPPEGVRS